MGIDDLRDYQRTDVYQGFLAEILASSAGRVAEEHAKVREAESQRRVHAAIAVRGGFGKTATAAALGVSRPTLDAWLAAVDTNADESARVAEHEAFVLRKFAKSASPPA